MQQGCSNLPVVHMFSSQKNVAMIHRLSKMQMKALCSKIHLWNSSKLNRINGIMIRKYRTNENAQVTPRVKPKANVIVRGTRTVENFVIFFIIRTEPVSSSPRTWDLYTACSKASLDSMLVYYFPFCPCPSVPDLPYLPYSQFSPSGSRLPERSLTAVTIIMINTVTNHMKIVPRWTFVNWARLTVLGIPRCTVVLVVDIADQILNYKNVFIQINKLCSFQIITPYKITKQMIGFAAHRIRNHEIFDYSSYKFICGLIGLKPSVN